MGKTKNRREKQRKSGLGRSSATTTKKFAAPTPGLKDVFFTRRTAKDAAKSKETVRELAWHVGMQPWKHSSLASKAMSSLAKPTIAAPARPVREYWIDSIRTTKTNNSMSNAEPPTALGPVKEDWDHCIDVDNYKTKLKTYQEKQEA